MILSPSYNMEEMENEIGVVGPYLRLCVIVETPCTGVLFTLAFVMMIYFVMMV